MKTGADQIHDPRCALVLGGSGGIGRAIVRRCARAGRDVVFTFLKAERTAEEVADEASELSRRTVRPVQLDVRDAERLGAVIDECAVSGLDLVVSAAGSGVPLASLSDFRDRHWRWTLDTHARAFGHLFQLSLPHLARTAGSIVALTSIGSRVVLPNYSLAGIAKGAIESAVRYAAWEAGPSGVRVNAVSPGLVATAAVEAYPEYEKWLADVARQTPLQRLTTPEDVADVVAWLASPAASMVTGQVVVVDGGWELRCGIE